MNPKEIHEIKETIKNALDTKIDLETDTNNVKNKIYTSVKNDIITIKWRSKINNILNISAFKISDFVSLGMQYEKLVITLLPQDRSFEINFDSNEQAYSFGEHLIDIINQD